MGLNPQVNSPLMRRPRAHAPHYWFNKTKQHTLASCSICLICSFFSLSFARSMLKLDKFRSRHPTNTGVTGMPLAYFRPITLASCLDTLSNRHRLRPGGGALYGQGFFPASRGPFQVRFQHCSPGDTTRLHH